MRSALVETDPQIAAIEGYFPSSGHAEHTVRIRILGCSGGIGRNLRTTSILLNHNVLIDMGTGACNRRPILKCWTSDTLAESQSQVP